VSRADRQRLRDILAAIGQIREYVDFAHAAGAELLPANLIGDAVLYRFVVMGEAASALSSEVLGRMPDVSWPDVVGMRNILTHEYFRIDWDVVEATVQRDLTDLETAVRHALADGESPRR
jgi:uncharacterized protein with HEPN domain